MTTEHTQGHEALAVLRTTAWLSFFNPQSVNKVLDVWADVLVDAFNLTLSGDDDVELETPNDHGWASAAQIISDFDAWLGHDVIDGCLAAAGLDE